MLVLVIVSAILFSPAARAGPSVSFFWPQGLSEEACTGHRSWTKWFNSAKPSDDSGNLDKEVFSKIIAQNGRDMCSTQYGLHAQTVGNLQGGTSYSASFQTMNGALSAFISNTPGTDYQIRFCCDNSAFVPTTTTTTTPRPITSGTCGREQIAPTLISSARIFGGQHATPNSWPWQVLYQELKPCGTNRICTGNCGGTLLDNRHVLTAAHCVGTTDPSKITIIAGLHNKQVNEETRQFRAVERIFMHSGWNETTLTNDMAILRLAEPVQFNRYVQSACLPGPDPKPDSEVVIIGWGAEAFGGVPYHQLKQAQVKVVGQCYRYWGQVDDEKQICVAHNTQGFSACQGDSGGPILQKHNGQWVVQGVASFVRDCKTHDNLPPNVYVRVSAYLPWINSIIY